MNINTTCQNHFHVLVTFFSLRARTLVCASSSTNTIWGCRAKCIHIHFVVTPPEEFFLRGTISSPPPFEPFPYDRGFSSPITISILVVSVNGLLPTSGRFTHAWSHANKDFVLTRRAGRMVELPEGSGLRPAPQHSCHR